MSEKITFTIDGVEVQADPGQTILQAATAAGIYIPHLCAHGDLSPWGSCRVCTVKVNGRPQSACTQPVGAGAVVENDTEELLEIRKDIIDMLFVEGNHYCMFCEASGNCELQALAYRFGITAPRFNFQYPAGDLDPSHPDILIDRNRCVLCARCVRSSKEIDHKEVFGFIGRGSHKKVTANAACGVAGTDAKRSDKAPDYCPVGALIRKRVGYVVPVGQRKYDHTPIGSQTEQKSAQ